MIRVWFSASRLSYITGAVGIFFALRLQYKLYLGYLEADGKTRALYGINHLLQSYWLVFGLVGILLVLLARYRKGSWNGLARPFFLNLFQILVVWSEWYRLLL